MMLIADTILGPTVLGDIEEQSIGTCNNPSWLVRHLRKKPHWITERARERLGDSRSKEGSRSGGVLVSRAALMCLRAAYGPVLSVVCRVVQQRVIGPTKTSLRYLGYRY